MSIKSFFVKSIRKIAHSGGYGIHSPFAFSFVSDIVYNPYSYYFFDYPLKIEKNCAIDRLSFDSEQKIGRLLFRIVEHFKLRNVVIIGKQHPSLCAYCIAPNSKIKFYHCDTNENIIDLIKNELSAKPCLLLLDDKKTFYEWNELFHLLIPLLNETIIIAIPRIQEDREKKLLWKEVCANPSIHVTFDLYDIGILFPKKNLYKKNYIVSF